MKSLMIAAGLVLTLLTGFSLNAQRIYTWTDENGVVNLSDQPPPETGKVDDIEVITYEEKTPQEIEAIQQKTENMRLKLDREKQTEKARQAEIQAGEAEKRARKAVQQAEEEYEYKNEYIRRLTSTQNKRKKFRKRVDRIKAEAEASLVEAQETLERAKKATQEARVTAEDTRRDQQN